MKEFNTELSYLQENKKKSQEVRKFCDRVRVIKFYDIANLCLLFDDNNRLKKNWKVPKCN